MIREVSTSKGHYIFLCLLFRSLLSILQITYAQITSFSSILKSDLIFYAYYFIKKTFPKNTHPLIRYTYTHTYIEKYNILYFKLRKNKMYPILHKYKVNRICKTSANTVPIAAIGRKCKSNFKDIISLYYLTILHYLVYRRQIVIRHSNICILRFIDIICSTFFYVKTFHKRYTCNLHKQNQLLIAFPIPMLICVKSGYKIILKLICFTCSH